MKIEVRFTHMERSEALETYALEKVRSALAPADIGPGHTQVWLVCEHSKVSPKGAPEYHCEIDVRARGSESFVEKANADMRIAINDAATTLRSVLHERAKRVIDSARATHRRAKAGPRARPEAGPESSRDEGYW